MSLAIDPSFSTIEEDQIILQLAAVPEVEEEPKRDGPLKRKCKFCERKFVKSEHLKRHQRTHTGERPYSCVYCEKSYSRSDVLTRHLKHHTQGPKTISLEVTQQNGDSELQIEEVSGSTDLKATRAKKRTTRRTVSAVSQNPPPVLEIPRTPNLDDLATISMQQDHRRASMNTVRPNIGLEDHLSPSRQRRRISESQAPSIQRCDEMDITPFPGNQIHPWEGNQVYEDQYPHDCLPSSVRTPASVRGSNFDHQYAPIQQIATPHLVEHHAQDQGLDAWISQFSNNFQIPYHSEVFLADHNGMQLEINYREPSTAPPNECPKEENEVPNERFKRVEKCWPTRWIKITKLMPTLWNDVASAQTPNLFSVRQASKPPSKQTTRRGLDDDCKSRLEAAFQASVCEQSPRPSNFSEISVASPEGISENGSTSSLSQASEFPSSEILDISLDLYFRQFHPLTPFIHIPSFDPHLVPDSMLFSMCLIGLNILDTKRSLAFVRRLYPILLQRVTTEISSVRFSKGSAGDMLATFATAYLTLSLGEMLGTQHDPGQCQSLYMTAILMMQQHGLFKQNDHPKLDPDTLGPNEQLEDRWKAWARIESAKRLVVCMMMVDTWFSGSLHAAPLIFADDLRLHLPCPNNIFAAKSSECWLSAIRTDQQSVVTLSHNDASLPDLQGPSDPFTMHAILSIVRLRISDAYHRLQTDVFSVPWSIYNRDHNARVCVPLALQICEKYDNNLRSMGTNCMMLWHNISMMLTSDLRIFELAAGAEGADRARKALKDITAWSGTPSARRACVHAAQTLKVATNRRVSDGIMFHFSTALFSAALVLGLYVYKVAECIDNSPPVELLGDVDWRRVGHVGLVDEISNDNDPIIRFIEHGGKFKLDDVVYEFGYSSARRILLDYASVLEEVAKWKTGPYSHILRIMSDALVDIG